METQYKVLLSNSSLEVLRVNFLNHIFPLHFHKRICFGKIDSGVKTLFIDGKKINFKKGDYFYIPPYKPHICYVNAGYTIICVNNIKQLLEEFSSNKILRQNIDEKTINLFIKQYYPETDICIKMNEKIVNLMKYIDQNYMESLSINFLSKYIFRSPDYLLHLFKKNVGISLHNYILQTRIKKFKEKILVDNNDTLDIALSCGFYDQSHTIRNFKKYIGITPQKYKNSISII